MKKIAHDTVNDLTVKEIDIPAIKQELLKYEPVGCPLKHEFTPGLYIREITMGKGSHVIGKEHRTTHPYAVMRGTCAVYNTEDKFLGYIVAPFRGTTKPSTRRLLVILEETSWVTYHPLDFITGEENDWPENKKEDLVERIELLLVGETVDNIYR